MIVVPSTYYSVLLIRIETTFHKHLVCSYGWKCQVRLRAVASLGFTDAKPTLVYLCLSLILTMIASSSSGS